MADWDCETLVVGDFGSELYALSCGRDEYGSVPEACPGRPVSSFPPLLRDKPRARSSCGTDSGADCGCSEGDWCCWTGCCVG